jgi:hypothetical protein
MLGYYAFPDDMSWESDGGMILTGENRRTPKKNLSQCYFVHHKSHMGFRGERPVTNDLSDGCCKLHEDESFLGYSTVYCHGSRLMFQRCILSL